MTAANIREKFTVCHAGCGASVPYKTSKKVYCDPCRKSVLKDRSRKTSEKNRRSKGVPEVKGTTANCLRCNAPFIRGGVRTKFCDPCKVEAPRDRARDRSRQKARDRNAPVIGESLSCGHCQKETQRLHSRSKYCPDCRELQKRGDLPHLKDANRKYKTEIWPDKYWNDPGVRDRALAGYKRSRLKRKKDPAFTVNERMSAGIRYSLGEKKAGSTWEALVPYALPELMQHLERQFVPGMSWANRGQWHIDHIVPLSSFKFTSHEEAEFKAAWALTNLRPLWATENMRKSAKRTHLI